ncbi:hypothetical protein BWQ96_09288 [Gracilariopsis chorda]|uniref:Uncharacterized protein n=1 Tax=Gracilariopsis chorda TaxID=448386 RepID=A0A2V3IG24_9FLOR|nr:hypothetical protein BWQ96_09288 [Gracilariopsis chorda]|eukprot:PXF40993.1 hypothetical protein BWQ96_09288 [Gracilariopsis chorda]
MRRVQVAGEEANQICNAVGVISLNKSTHIDEAAIVSAVFFCASLSSTNTSMKGRNLNPAVQKKEHFATVETKMPCTKTINLQKKSEVDLEIFTALK